MIGEIPEKRAIENDQPKPMNEVDSEKITANKFNAAFHPVPDFCRILFYQQK